MNLLSYLWQGLRNVCRYVLSSTLCTVTGLVVLSILIHFGVQFTKAAVSYDVSNEVQMFLDASINSTQTTGIIASSPQVNGTNFVFSTTTGGIIRIRSGAYREDFAYTSATVNSSTNKVTFAGVTRGICPQVTRAITSCSLGRNWGKGAIMELTVDARLLNTKLNIDRQNILTARGGIRFSGSGSLGQPVFASTADRDRQLGSAPATASGYAACVTATGLCYDGLGGAWVARGSSATPNADTTTAGKVEIGTIADQIAKTGNGDSGASTMVATQHLTLSGSIHNNNSYQYGRIPILNTSGALSTTLGGLGTTKLSTGALLTAAGSGAVQLVKPSDNSGAILQNDGVRWKMRQPFFQVLDVKTVANSSVYAASTAENTLYQFALSGSKLTAGSIIQIHLSGTHNGPVDQTVRLRVGSASGTVMAASTGFDFSAGGSGDFTFNGSATIRSTGAGGTAAGDFSLLSHTNATYAFDTSSSNISVNTTGSVRFTVTIQFHATNGNNEAHYEQAYATLFTP